MDISASPPYAIDRPRGKFISRKLQSELLRAHDFVLRHNQMSAAIVALLFHVPAERWTAALLRQEAADAALLDCFHVFLRQAAADRARRGRIVLAVVGRGANMQVVCYRKSVR